MAIDLTPLTDMWESTRTVLVLGALLFVVAALIAGVVWPIKPDASDDEGDGL